MSNEAVLAMSISLAPTPQDISLCSVRDDLLLGHAAFIHRVEHQPLGTRSSFSASEWGEEAVDKSVHAT